MSTQSIKNVSIEEIQDMVDRALALVGNKFMVEYKFGIKAKVNKQAIFHLLYFKKYFKFRGSRNISKQQQQMVSKIISKYIQ